MHVADSGNRITYPFCPECGSTVHYAIEGKFDGLVAIPAGRVRRSLFPDAQILGLGRAQADWVEILGDVEHSTNRLPAIAGSVSKRTPHFRTGGEATRPTPRLIDAQEIAAHQLLQPRLAPAALLEVARRTAGSGRRCYSPRPSDRRRPPRPATAIPALIRSRLPFVDLRSWSPRRACRQHAIVGADADMVLARDLRDMLDMGDEVGALGLAVGGQERHEIDADHPALVGDRPDRLVVGVARMVGAAPARRYG